ncbi:flagellar basal body P-ring formation protein FlgA, partial [Candidatus Aerophobetes bacterium]|nr:flagellar basal body P-ring formation protein FlgA [Candidatus Aerophobetes bacterium]
GGFILIIILSFLLGLSFSAYPVQINSRNIVKIIITLKDKVKVKGNCIYLGEIVKDIKAEKKLKNKLYRIKIGASPLPGKSRRLNKDYIMVRLYQNGLYPGQVLIKGKNEIVVLREDQDLSLSRKNYSPSAGVEDNLVIRQGNLVNLIVEDKNIKIITRGKALNSGRKGDKIRVLNTTSFKILEGEVIDSFTVKIVP